MLKKRTTKTRKTLKKKKLKSNTFSYNFSKPHKAAFYLSEIDNNSVWLYNYDMNKEKLNEIIQWTGTFFILAMYVLMNFFRELGLDPVCGLLGGLCYALWAYRVANKPQMLVNVVAITVCVVGLVKSI